MLTWGEIHRDRRTRLSLALLAPLAAIGVWFLIGSGSPGPAGTSSPRAMASASPTPSPSRTATPSATPSPTPSPTPTPTPTPAGLEDGRFTLLVLGSDSDVNRRARGSGWLTDAITVVSVAADGSHVLMVSLPRDTSDIPMPDGTVWTSKVNALAPTLGPATLGDAMSLLLGLQIDHHVMVDMDGFRQIANALGGVPVSVPYTLTDGSCSIGPGDHVLDGTLALCYARHRATDSDYERADRHQQLLLGIRDQVLAGGVDPAALIGSIGSLQTDVPAGEIPYLMELAERTAGGAEVQRLVLGPPEFTTFAGIAGSRGWISIPDVPVIQATVASLLESGGHDVGSCERPIDPGRCNSGR